MPSHLLLYHESNPKSSMLKTPLLFTGASVWCCFYNWNQSIGFTWWIAHLLAGNLHDGKLVITFNHLRFVCAQRMRLFLWQFNARLPASREMTSLLSLQSRICQCVGVLDVDLCELCGTAWIKLTTLFCGGTFYHTFFIVGGMSSWFSIITLVGSSQ